MGISCNTVVNRFLYACKFTCSLKKVRKLYCKGKYIEASKIINDIKYSDSTKLIIERWKRLIRIRMTGQNNDVLSSAASCNHIKQTCENEVSVKSKHTVTNLTLLVVITLVIYVICELVSEYYFNWRVRSEGPILFGSPDQFYKMVVSAAGIRFLIRIVFAIVLFACLTYVAIKRKLLEYDEIAMYKWLSGELASMSKAFSINAIWRRLIPGIILLAIGYATTNIIFDTSINIGQGADVFCALYGLPFVLFQLVYLLFSFLLIFNGRKENYKLSFKSCAAIILKSLVVAVFLPYVGIFGGVYAGFMLILWYQYCYIQDKSICEVIAMHSIIAIIACAFSLNNVAGL